MASIQNIFQHNIKHWYIPLIIGIVFICMGIYTFFQPMATYHTLAFLFALSFLFSGISGTYFSIANKEELEGWGWYLFNGILSSILGIYLLANPVATASILPLVIGFYVLMNSIQGLIIAYELKKYGILEWGTVALFSIIGIIFGLLLIFNPIFGGITLVMLTGFGLITIGALSILLSLSTKKLKNRFDKMPSATKEKIRNFQKDYNDEIERLRD